MARSNMLFDALNNILVTKSLEICERHFASPDFKDFSRYMCQRYLTMCLDHRVQELILENYATLERMDDKAFYKWALKAVPKQRSGFIRYLR